MSFDDIRIFCSSFKINDDKIEFDVLCPKDSNLMKEIKYLLDNNYSEDIYYS